MTRDMGNRMPQRAYSLDRLGRDVLELLDAPILNACIFAAFRWAVWSASGWLCARQSVLTV
jgi:hypothetical protein